MCSLFPGEIGVKCKILVDEYLPKIIDLIINEGLKPDAVCKAIELCTEPKSTFFFLTFVTKSNRKAMNRNWSNQKANPALKTKTGNK